MEMPEQGPELIATVDLMVDDLIGELGEEAALETARNQVEKWREVVARIESTLR